MDNKVCEYVELAQGGLFARNNIVLKKDVLSLIKTDEEVYTTYFRYPIDIKTHVDTKGTVSGYKGIHDADFLPIDVDSSDLREAQQNAIQILETLKHGHDLDLDFTRIFFSGSKGFHILIPKVVIGYKPSVDLSKKFKMFAKELFGGKADLMIYDTTRLFRFPGTINEKSGLRKTPLEVGELYSLEINEIMELSKTRRKIICIPYDEMSQNDSLHELFESIEIPREKPIENLSFQSQGLMPYRKMCYEKMLQQTAGVKNRNIVSTRIAYYLKLNGLPFEIAKATLEGWRKLVNHDGKLEQEEIERAVRSIYERDYSYGCNDEICVKYCDRRCKLYKVKEENIVKPYYFFEEIEYVTEPKERVLSGIDQLDCLTKGFEMGCCTVWSGVTNSGKTTVLTQLTGTSIEQGYKVFFFNGEQTKNDFQNNVYKQSSYKDEIFIKKYKDTKIEDSYVNANVVKRLLEKYGKNLIVYNNESSKTIDSLINAMEEVNEKYGVKVYILDNFMQVELETRDYNQEQTSIMEKIRTFAVNKGCHVHLVAHPKKPANDITVRLSLYDIAGTMNIPNKAYNVISIVRKSMIKDKKEKKSIEEALKYSNYNFNFSDGFLEVLKTKGFDIGLVSIDFDKVTGRYKESNKQEEIQEPNKESDEPIWDDLNDLPF